MRKLPLSEDLEQAILHVLLKGVVHSDVVDPAELSKLGQGIYKAHGTLVAGGAVPPFAYQAVLLAAVEAHDADKNATIRYLQAVKEVGSGVETSEILRRVRDKQLLVDLITAASDQLSKGSLDIGLIGGLLVRDTKHDLSSVSERVKDGLPDPPRGLGFGSLSRLQKATGGIIGVWAMAGEPGIGKSTLAWQLSLDVGRHGVPVLYYDFENGFAVLMDHTRSIFQGDLGRIRQACELVYHRDSIRSLDSDLGRVKPPALIVVDSVQKLPASMEYRRQGLDRWIHRLEYLKKRGYYVLLVSEIGRASYASDAHMGAFKETGEIEYSADVGIQLVPHSETLVELNIVKNRHRPYKGTITYMRRHRDWLFQEITDGVNESEEID